jgi:hypothetical protein
MDIVDPQKNDNDDFQQNNLILQHARLTIVRDSPCIAKVTKPLVVLWNWVFSALCCCKKGGFSFILREQNFGTTVLSQLVLQHAHLTIVRDSPCIARVARATGHVVELSFQHVMLLQRGRIFIYFTRAKLWHHGSQFDAVGGENCGADAKSKW